MKLILLIFFLTLSHLTHAKLLKILPVKDFKEVQTLLNEHIKHPEETLMAVDIDLTLTMPHHPALDGPNYKEHKKIFNEIFSSSDPLFIEKAFTHAIMLSGQKQLESDAPQILKNYIKKGIKVIGFTASIIGPLPPVQGVEAMRHQILESFGFSFTHFSGADKVVLTDIPLYNGCHPTFYEGILFANGGRAPHNKGDVIRSFLTKVQFRPKLFIIIDDRLKNIEEIASSLEFHDPDIQVLGLEYTGAQDHSERILSQEEFKTFWTTVRAQLEREETKQK